VLLMRMPWPSSSSEWSLASRIGEDTPDYFFARQAIPLLDTWRLARHSSSISRRSSSTIEMQRIASHGPSTRAEEKTEDECKEEHRSSGVTVQGALRQGDEEAGFQSLPDDSDDDDDDDDEDEDEEEEDYDDERSSSWSHSPEDYSSWARANDELSRAMADGRSLHGFVEGDLSFPPSFRWVRGARADYSKAGVEAFRGCYTLHKKVSRLQRNHLLSDGACSHRKGLPRSVTCVTPASLSAALPRPLPTRARRRSCGPPRTPTGCFAIPCLAGRPT
jgi:hypothetical protein